MLTDTSQENMSLFVVLAALLGFRFCLAVWGDLLGRFVFFRGVRDVALLRFLP